jgi:Oxidoreductase family, NAD-binding Rossmann fold
LAAAALVGGKHVLVDKPMAVNAAEGERMLAAASAHSKQVRLTARGVNLRQISCKLTARMRQACPAAGACSRTGCRCPAPVCRACSLCACCRSPLPQDAHVPPLQVAIVDHELRFVPAFQRARELLLDGAIGAVLGMESTAILVRTLRCTF